MRRYWRSGWNKASWFTIVAMRGKMILPIDPSRYPSKSKSKLRLNRMRGYKLRCSQSERWMNINNWHPRRELKWVDDCGIVRIKQSIIFNHSYFEGRWNDSSDWSVKKIRAGKSKSKMAMWGYEWRCYPIKRIDEWSLKSRVCILNPNRRE